MLPLTSDVLSFCRVIGRGSASHSWTLICWRGAWHVRQAPCPASLLRSLLWRRSAFMQGPSIPRFALLAPKRCKRCSYESLKFIFLETGLSKQLLYSGLHITSSSHKKPSFKISTKACDVIALPFVVGSSFAGNSDAAGQARQAQGPSGTCNGAEINPSNLSNGCPPVQQPAKHCSKCILKASCMLEQALPAGSVPSGAQFTSACHS